MSEHLKASQKYREHAILSAPRERIISYLYQGLERFLQQSIEALERREPARAGESLGKAQGILWELLGSLNMKEGGVVAENLAKLYRFMIDRLLDANLRQDPKPLEGCLQVLASLQEGWDGLLEKRSEA